MAGVLLGATAAPASAWPIPLTPDQNSYLNAARAAGFPGDDDALVMAGEQACRLLYSAQRAPAVTDAITAQFGADLGQAAGIVRAARGTLCTQAPS